MAIFDTVASMMADSAGKTLINQHIGKYGKLKSLFFKDGKINASLILNGFDDKKIYISCASVKIADDGSEISLGDFSSNVPCIEQALNDFCTRTFLIKSTKAQYTMMIIKKLLL
ncbi:MAG: hypothetical protein HDR50_12010 [Desulfovibrio sp.]|uniref:hypothetical protein n=1 Tax=Desulfovibrio sp. TaxID=885 RepID=UPI001A771E2F|nr:hypothetical protein [Desulfovibrio sp.]MBD5418336.1 hypothetical protein [Desulfovibrio sp.]